MPNYRKIKVDKAYITELKRLKKSKRGKKIAKQIEQILINDADCLSLYQWGIMPLLYDENNNQIEITDNPREQTNKVYEQIYNQIDGEDDMDIKKQIETENRLMMFRELMENENCLQILAMKIKNPNQYGTREIAKALGVSKSNIHRKYQKIVKVLPEFKQVIHATRQGKMPRGKSKLIGI